MTKPLITFEIHTVKSILCNRNTNPVLAIYLRDTVHLTIDRVGLA